MAVDRCQNLLLTGLDIDHEVKQSAPIVGLREALAMQQAATFEFGVGQQEAIGCHEADPWMFRPDGQQLAE